ncbi:MAG: hypothetical protein ACJA2W_000170 [Planctomycetota bacterium]|jgi:hypothetical protein
MSILHYTSIPTFALLALVGCSNTQPNVTPIDGALLASAPTEGRATVTAARAALAANEDAYALAQNHTTKAAEQVHVARVSLRTVRSELDESKLAIEVAEGGTQDDLDRARAAHAYALANADYMRDLLAFRKRELDLAKLEEKASQEEARLSRALVELRKAEAVQTVNLVSAQRVPIQDYRNQVYFHQEEVEVAIARVRSAKSRIAEAQIVIDEAKGRLDRLKPATR